MSPPYIFRIDEIRENPGITPSRTSQGDWTPSVKLGYNYRTNEGVTGRYWFCERDRIRTVPDASLPTLIPTLVPFSVFSVFYSDGRDFWVLRGDGTAPATDESWHPLRFEHDEKDESSFLTPAGTENTLQGHRPDQTWVHMLLPSNFHGPRIQGEVDCGLTGELPIFLALVALSMQPEKLPSWLPWMFQNSKWQVHSLPHGRTHKRGVVVYVYTCPTTWAGGSSSEDLENFETGEYGNYYN